MIDMVKMINEALDDLPKDLKNEAILSWQEAKKVMLSSPEIKDEAAYVQFAILLPVFEALYTCGYLMRAGEKIDV